MLTGKRGSFEGVQSYQELCPTAGKKGVMTWGEGLVLGRGDLQYV